MAFWTNIEQYIMAYGLNVLGGLVILLLGFWLARITRNAIRKIGIATRLDDTFAFFLARLAYFTILTITILSSLERFGVKTTSFLAILGAIGIALGLALKNSLSNLASGVLLLVLRPFCVDDKVEVGGTTGKVEALQIYHTVLRDEEGTRIFVPNSRILSLNIVNYTPDQAENMKTACDSPAAES